MVNSVNVLTKWVLVWDETNGFIFSGMHTGQISSMSNIELFEDEEKLMERVYDIEKLTNHKFLLEVVK